jgi:hypothetical protein
MASCKFPVLIESRYGRAPVGLSVRASAQPCEVSIALREKGWRAYQVHFDAEEVAWVARVIDWGLAA